MMSRDRRDSSTTCWTGRPNRADLMRTFSLLFWATKLQWWPSTWSWWVTTKCVRLVVITALAQMPGFSSTGQSIRLVFGPFPVCWTPVLVYLLHDIHRSFRLYSTRFGLYCCYQMSDFKAKMRHFERGSIRPRPCWGSLHAVSPSWT